MSGQLLKTISPLVIATRAKGFKAKGGIRYPGGIIYFPRTPNHKDPEITPSKLFRVERIKGMKHNPWWQKKILKDLHIDEEDKVTVVKNSPEWNLRLWKVKHLIKITPIVFPYGEPTREDINHTILKENGECLVTKKLAIDPMKIEALDKFHASEKKMDSTTIKNDSRRKWNEPLGGGF